MSYKKSTRFGQRFVEPREFGSYADQLHIVDNPSQDQLLEFLEREKLLIPVRRIHIPEAIHRRLWLEYNTWGKEDPSLEVERDDTACEGAHSLIESIGLFNSQHPHAPSIHPIDVIADEHAPFIIMNPASEHFRHWKSFNIRVGRFNNGDSCFDTSIGMRTYYHYYQVFVLSEIMDTGLHVVYDGRQTDTESSLRKGLFQDVAEKCFRRFNWAGWHALKELEAHARVLDAVALFVFYKNRLFSKYFRDKSELDAKESRLLQGDIRNLALWSIEKCDVSHEIVIESLKWQCARWGDRDGRNPILAEEYRKNIRATVELYRHVTGRKFDELATLVGRVTGHFIRTLDVVFPDRELSMGRDAKSAFNSWIKPLLAPLVSTPYDITAVTVDQFVDWTLSAGMVQILHHLNQVNELGFGMDCLSSVARHQELVGTAIAIEHMIVYMAESTNNVELRRQWNASCEHETLAKRIQWLWRSDNRITAGLKGCWKLTNTKRSLRWQLRAIRGVRRGGKLRFALQAVLRTMLIRNYCAHRGMRNAKPREIHGLFEHLLIGAILTWKRASVMGLLKPDCT